MSILSFPLKGSSCLQNPEIKFYELRNDALSVNGAHPCAGDICAVRMGEEVEGEPHMIRNQEGRIMCGLLYREGKNIVLEFPNPTFRPYRRDARQIKVLGRVERFYCATKGNVSSGLEFSDESMLYEVAEVGGTFIADLPVVGFEQTVPIEQTVNWHANARGILLDASERWFRVVGSTLEELADFGYLNKAHPDQRDGVARRWIDSLRTRSAFLAECRIETIEGYKPSIIMAVPVNEPWMPEAGWAGTLHLLEPTSS